MPLHLIPPGRRKGNRFFLARGSVGGRVYEINTHATDEKAARRFAAAFEREIRAAAPTPGDRITFAEAARRYIQFRNPSPADRRRLDRVTAEFGRRRLSDIRPADVHEVAMKLAGEHKAATRNRDILRPIVTVLHYAADAGLCDWLRVRAFKEPRPKTRALDPDAAAALIAAARTPAQRRLLVWLFLQGTRISDTLRLQWTDLDLAGRTVSVTVSKTGRVETFPLHEATVAELLRVEDRSGPLFPWSNRSSLRRWLPQLCAEVGVAFTPHMARHTLGTMMAANGATLRAIMGALGHSSASSSVRYQGADIEMVRAAAGRVRLPQVKRLGTAR